MEWDASATAPDYAQVIISISLCLIGVLSKTAAALD